MRIADALGLGSEDEALFSAYEIQLRRRLWYFVGILDTHAALDRGSRPIIPIDAMGPAPLSVADADLIPGKVPIVLPGELNDMSFTSMIHDAVICQKRLCDVSSTLDDPWDGWQRKLESVTAFETSAHANCAAIGEDASPIHKLRALAAAEIAANMHILLRRPPYRPIQAVVPPWDHFAILDAGIQVLERSLQKGSNYYIEWRWKSWAKWYILAIVLAELSVCSHDRLLGPEYAIARRSFIAHRKLVADGEDGKLWGPITKLMTRVEQLRQTAVESRREQLASDDILAWDQDQSTILTHAEGLDSFDTEGANNLDAGDQTPAVDDSFFTYDPVAWQGWDSFLLDAYRFDGFG